MRHVRIASVLVMLAVGLSSVPWQAHAAPAAQEVAPSAAQQDDALLARLQQAGSGQVRVSRHEDTGRVRFLATNPDAPLARSATLVPNATGEQAARDFLVQYGKLFGLRDQAQELRTESSRTVQSNAFTRFQQMFAGVPVFGAELRVHTNGNGQVVSANGEMLPDLAVDVKPRLTPSQAKELALGKVGKDYKVKPAALRTNEPQLWIYNPVIVGAPGTRLSALVWRMEVNGWANGDPIRELVLVDAQRASVVLNFNQLAHGRDRRVCDFENVPNDDNTCTPAQYDRVEGQPPTGVADVDKAYAQHGAVYDYYFRNFGRDSIDNNGMPIIATVRYCPSSFFCPYQNAFWDGRQMTYGAGFVVDDVVAHELTHGVTDYESRLFYYYQAGAINESLSDVFGELFDLQYAGGSNDSPAVRWLVGEDLPEIGAIRNMKNPPQFGDPDRVRSLKYYDREGDQGGVHINSGISNKAAYLMTDGDTFNGQTIRGIGAYKTAYIYYVANTQYLVSASDYQDLGDILPQACDFLASGGIKITTAADCAEVRKVVLATEMHLRPLTTRPEASICPANQAVNDVWFDNLENPQSGNWRSGPTRPNTVSDTNEWYYPQTDNPYDFDATYATSGKYNLWGYNTNTTGDYNIAMTRDVRVPANAYLHMRHSYDFEAGSFDTYDGGLVEYSTDGGRTYKKVDGLFVANGYNGDISPFFDNPLANRNAFVDRSKGYISSRLNLASLAGQNVRFRFRIGTDSSFDDWGWFIDDIRVYTCRAN